MCEHTVLFVDSHWGIYVPQRFAEIVTAKGHRDLVTGVSPEDWEILMAGPEHEYYWDTWDDVLDNARVGAFHLHQDGDLWLVDWDAMTDEEREEFAGC